MGTNRFGTLFQITTWGESHGRAIGVVIDGCPAGLEITVEEIQSALNRRSPGGSPYTSPRQEGDLVEILSGVFEGKTTGAPISLLIPNRDADSAPYEAVRHLLRPGHANYTYLEKYGLFDHRGGGRASARETACRVAAGAIAQKLLQQAGIVCRAYLQQVGEESVEEKMMQRVAEAQAAGDSVGGAVAFEAHGLPVGLGDPVYEKLEANLAKAMLSLPAAKGFEIGSGFRAVAMCGSEHNDIFVLEEGRISTATNHAGGTLGGISTGLPLLCRVAFKPTSSIRVSQETVQTDGSTAVLQFLGNFRHDPCVAIRAVAVVEAMGALVLADALLLHRSARL